MNVIIIIIIISIIINIIIIIITIDIIICKFLCMSAFMCSVFLSLPSLFSSLFLFSTSYRSFLRPVCLRFSAPPPSPHARMLTDKRWDDSRAASRQWWSKGQFSRLRRSYLTISQKRVTLTLQCVCLSCRLIRTNPTSSSGWHLARLQCETCVPCRGDPDVQGAAVGRSYWRCETTTRRTASDGRPCVGAAAAGRAPPRRTFRAARGIRRRVKMADKRADGRVERTGAGLWRRVTYDPELSSRQRAQVGEASKISLPRFRNGCGD